MDLKQAASEKVLTTKILILPVAFELDNSLWEMACSDNRKVRHINFMT